MHSIDSSKSWSTSNGRKWSFLVYSIKLPLSDWVIIQSKPTRFHSDHLAIRWIQFVTDLQFNNCPQSILRVRLFQFHIKRMRAVRWWSLRIRCCRIVVLHLLIAQTASTKTFGRFIVIMLSPIVPGPSAPLAPWCFHPLVIWKCCCIPPKTLNIFSTSKPQDVKTVRVYFVH